VVRAEGAGARRAPRDGEIAPPRFYGQPLGGHPAEKGANYSLSPAKVPLTWAGEHDVSHLAFLFRTTTPAATERVPLALSYAVSHLEHDIRHVPGVDDYESSRWIGLVTGPFETPLPGPAGAAETDMPVVLRALPQPPSVIGQFVIGGAETGSPADLARWSYRFDFVHRGAAQDSVTATVELGRGDGGPFTGSPADDLFAALAQFTSDPEVLAAREALAALEAVVGALARAYDAWSRPAAALTAAPDGSAAHVTHSYVIDLEAGPDGRARVDVHAGGEAPAADVEIDPERLRAEPVTPGGGARWAWEYAVIGSNPPRYLTHAEALALPERRLTLGPLDAFARQDAHAAVEVVRNRRLVQGADTMPAFQFATPAVRFADRAVPLLHHDAVALRSGADVRHPLEGYLDAFFRALFARSEGQRVSLKADCSYSFEIAPGLSPTVVPVVMMPPVDHTPGDAPPAFVAPLAHAVESWLTATDPPRTPGSRLSFAVEVYGAPEGDQSLPLVTIRDLFVPLDEFSERSGRGA
jgi:hypothetical protein